MMKQRAQRNKTLTLSEADRKRLSSVFYTKKQKTVNDALINAELLDSLLSLPNQFADMLFLDPPYNLDKNFNGFHFKKMDHAQYRDWIESWFPALLRTLKPHASIYFCGDWKNSAAIFEVLEKYCVVRNRIVWQREKGRGAAANWKNSCEDIWFATIGNDYKFNLDAVKVRKKVIAPYRTKDGEPKDWQEDANGKFRLTCPGNFWDDLTVPYWSMPENTDHPTQKPEKLLAKLILASTDPGDLVFDPFLGSGTTAVAAKKLGRHFCGIEMNQEYCLWAAARLERAAQDQTIQGFEDGIFKERNT
ncbi:MAG: site-specific DNA-methyltransferase [Lentisphaeria bacterium]|nr:site-specific DNA-methyltransferase [Lentisphaeria bacterium]